MEHKNPITFTHQTVVIVVYIVLIMSFSLDSMLGYGRKIWIFGDFCAIFHMYGVKSEETWSAVGARKSGEIHQAQGSTFWLVFRGPPKTEQNLSVEQTMT
jgi:hypothetical protein